MPNFPGYPLDTTKTNATPTTDIHPADHNSVNAAANDLQGQVNALALEDADLQTQITALDTAKVDLAGDTMSGLLVLSADPAAALGAATKQYVDARQSTSVAAVLLSGSGENATTAATFSTWLTTGTITVPTWAVTAIVQVNLANVGSITAGSTYALDCTIFGGSYTADYGAIAFAAASETKSTSFVRSVALAGTGSRAVLIGARRVAGSGQITAGSATKITVAVTFVG